MTRLGWRRGSTSGWTDVALQGIGIAVIGLTVDDATIIGIADDPLIPVLLAAGVGVYLAKHQDPLWEAPGNPGWKGWDWNFSDGQGDFSYKPPDKGPMKWAYIVYKVIDAITNILGGKE